jgi:hypothetical protein
MKLKKNLLLWNYWANLNQTFLKWSLGGPLSKMCPSAPSCRSFLCEFPIRSYVKLISAVGAILIEGPNRRTHIWKRTIQWLFHQNFVLIEQTKMAAKLKIEKRGWNKKNIFSSETTEPISTKLFWNDPWVVPFQKCVRQRRKKLILMLIQFKFGHFLA